MTKDVLKYLQPNAVIPSDMETTTALVNALKERLAQEKALQALHSENERLGLYKDAYAEQEPVAFASHGVVNWIADKQFQHEADLYTTPQPQQERKCDNCGEFGSCCQQPQREWVDLPDKLIDKTSWEFAEYEGFQHGARWAQTKLKELNT